MEIHFVSRFPSFPNFSGFSLSNHVILRPTRQISLNTSGLALSVLTSSLEA